MSIFFPSYSWGYFQVFKFKLLTRLSQFPHSINCVAIFASELRRKTLLSFLLERVLGNKMEGFDWPNVFIHFF